MVLQKMRAGAQGITAKILVGLIVFVLAVFGFGAFDLFSVSDPVAATVNGEDITQHALELETARQRSYRRSRLGEEVPDELLEQLITREAVLASMIDQTLLRQAAGDLRLSVAEETVQDRIRETFADEQTYRTQLANSGYTPAAYQAKLTDILIESQLEDGVRSTAFVTDRELRRAARLNTQRRDIAWLLFDVESLAAGVAIKDDEIEEYYGANLDDYMTEERFDFDFVRMPRSSLEAEVEVDEEAIALAYQDEIAVLSEPRRRAAHILLEVDDERSAEDAKEILAGIRAELEGGASFEEKARELSEDPGSASEGGDLGASGQGVFPPAFEEALWALEPGAVSQPVETEFGVHLVKLIEIDEADIPTLDQRRDEIEADLRRDEAQRRFERTLGEMDEIAFELGDSLDALTSEFSLTVEHLDGATRSSRDGILADRAVRKSLFSDEVLEGFNSRAVATDIEAVVARLRTRHPATKRPLHEVREEIRTRLANDRARQLADEAVFNALAALTDGDTPAELADRTDIQWQRSDGTESNDANVPRAILRLAFEMAAPADGERETEIATLADGSRALVVLSNVALGDYGTLAETDRSALASSLGQLDAERDFAALMAALHAEASIDALAFQADDGL